MASVEFAKEVKVYGDSTLSHWIAEFTSGYTMTRTDGGCYGAISAYGEGDDYWDDEEEVYVDGEREEHGLTSLCVFHPFKLLQKGLAEFVLSDEFYGPAFITKDIKKGKEQGFDLDVSKPYNYLLGGMIALRTAFNSDGRFFDKFIKVGASPLEALYLNDCHMRDDEHNTIYYLGSKYDHSIFPSSLTLPELINNPSPIIHPAWKPASEQGWLNDSVWDAWPNKWSRDLVEKRQASWNSFNPMSFNCWSYYTSLPLTDEVFTKILEAHRSGMFG